MLRSVQSYEFVFTLSLLFTYTLKYRPRLVGNISKTTRINSIYVRFLSFIDKTFYNAYGKLRNTGKRREVPNCYTKCTIFLSTFRRAVPNLLPWVSEP